jgi:type I restriction enzyme R subunit
MNKKDLSERDICTKFISPAVKQAGWDEMTQVREEVSFTKGRILVRGKLVTRGKAKRADYILYYKPNIPLAIIEAKDNNHSVGDGMQQALDYAATLNIPFVFSSNGDGFVLHDRTGTSPEVETNLALDAFPSPDALWKKYRAWKGLTPEAEKIILQDYFDDGSGKAPRYYQCNAVNAAVEAIANGQDRILLVMATGTGKTYTAFQIIWRLWKAGRKKRILFLADRNVLVDQTMVNDFRPFGAAMAKLSTSSKTIERADGSETELTTALDKKRRIDTAYEIYLALYQAITGPEGRQKLYREFSPGFFDLIVVDECHRGSADEDAGTKSLPISLPPRKLASPPRPRKPSTSQTSTTSASRYTPIRSNKASRTASWRRTKSSKFTSTAMSRATVPKLGSLTVTATKSRTAFTTRRILTAPS